MNFTIPYCFCQYKLRSNPIGNILYDYKRNQKAECFFTIKNRTPHGYGFVAFCK